MAYNTKKIKRDVDGNPIPQVYNPAADEYEVLQGGSGASRHMLYSPDGTPVDTTGNKLGVRATEVEQALTAILTQLDTTGLKKIIDALPAGSNKIGKVDVEVSALPAGAATEAKQDSTISELQNLQGKDFATQTTLAAILAKIIAAPSTEAKQDALAALIGEVQANPTANTLLARLKSLEDKIDAIVDGTAPAVMQLSGSFVCYSNETKPAGTKGNNLLEIDTGNVYVHDGMNWVVI